MNSLERTLEPGTATINGKPVVGMGGVRLDGRSLEIRLHRRAGISLYTFNALMLPIASKRLGTEEYVFDGPMLGLYHDTADIREGPYINHSISHLEISINYLSSDEAYLHIRGRADLSKSYFDSHSYKGPTTGDWNFDVSFVHKFVQG